MKILFAPVGIIAGLIAGLIAKKGFEKAWSVIDDQEAPEPDQRDVPTGKLIAALAIEGAIFRVTKGDRRPPGTPEVCRRHRPLARQGPGQRRRLTRRKGKAPLRDRRDASGNCRGRTDAYPSPRA